MNAPSLGGDGNGFETTPTNAYSDNATFAKDINSGNGPGSSCSSNDKDKHQFYGYTFAVPQNATILGIEVRLDAKVDSTAGLPKMCVQLSSDGGATWTPVYRTTPTLSQSEQTYILGGATDLWGRTWLPTDFYSANFRIRIVNVTTSLGPDFWLDWAAVKVYYR